MREAADWQPPCAAGSTSPQIRAALLVLPALIMSRATEPGVPDVEAVDPGANTVTPRPSGLADRAGRGLA